MSNVETGVLKKIGAYSKDKLLDGFGVKRARKVAGGHPVIDFTQGKVDTLALASGATDIAIPFVSRGFAIGEGDEAIDPDGCCLRFPGAILAEFGVNFAGVYFAKAHGNGWDSVQVFAEIKAAQIGVVTVGKDIVTFAATKAESILTRPG